MKVLVTAFALNEHGKIETVIKRLFDAKSLWCRQTDNTCHFDIALMDDGSTDGAPQELEKSYPIIVLRHTKNLGAGASVRTVNRYAVEKGYDVVVYTAGNNKDEPKEVERLVNPILNEGCDFVQGSRYLKGGGSGNTPFYRRLATRFVHPILFSLITGRRITDSTNGFRAVRTSLLRDTRINCDQDWLNKYELEPYLFYKSVKLGYKVKEVPVTKIYPPRKSGYTKMKAITGWWSILRPLVLLGFGIKK
jgi:dolichol-phosphate mannosyltransferase